MTRIDSFVYSPADVREMDRIAIQELKIPGYALMERAGHAAFADARAFFPDARRWLVICGAGNNAGDGYVIARLGQAAGFDVRVVTVSDPGLLAGDAARAFKDFRAASGDDGPDINTLVSDALCADADLIVDALLGTGLGRPLTGDYLAAVETVERAGRPVLAVDVPSGLNSETGEVMGAAIRAALTSTFVGLKQGFFLGAGPDRCGELRFHDLDIPGASLGGIRPSMRIFGGDDLRDLVRPRERTAHKGRFGHVLVIGGNRGMGGAARLAGEAALRAGAGLVSIATRPENVSAITAYRPELMCRGIESAADLQSMLERATVIALGPGLGRDTWAEELFAMVVNRRQPTILDADALNLLAEQPIRREDWILTPHPGEAARLLGTETSMLQRGRLSALDDLNDRYGGVAVLKGNCTLIGAAGNCPYVIDRGNPGMATAGMGDVLTGLTAAMVAQAPAVLQQSAAGAAYVHALAGDLAAQSGQRGLIATDLFSHLRPILNPDG